MDFAMANWRAVRRAVLVAAVLLGLRVSVAVGRELPVAFGQSASSFGAAESSCDGSKCSHHDSAITLCAAKAEGKAASHDGEAAGGGSSVDKSAKNDDEAKDDDQDADEKDGDDEEDSDEEDEEEPPGWLLPPEHHEWGPFTVEYVYTADTFSNVHGGIRTRDATKYRGLFDLTINCDLDKLAGVEGGTFFVDANDGHGRGITADYVGDYQYISNIDARNMTQVSEYWWMQKFADETLTTKLGKQDANADFCTLDSTSDFINSSFGLIPNVLLPTFPDPSVGMALFYEPDEKLWCGFGIYDGSPDGRTWGWTDWAGEGTVVVSEAAFRPNYFDGLFPGAYHAGIWYHSGDFDDLLSGQPHAGNYGVYCNAEQMIWKESTDPENDQGVSTFFQFGWAPEAWNPIGRYYGTGLLWKGPLCGRDNDYIGVGLARAEFSPAAPGALGSSPEMPYLLGGPPRPIPLGAGPGSQLSETVVELFYLSEIRPWLHVEPDVQFIGSPSGTQRDALAVGLRFEIAL